MRILILLLTVAGACSRGETSEPVERALEPTAEEAARSEEEAAPEQSPEPPTGAEGPQQGAPAVDLDAPPTVELLDAGKEPRKTLRTAFEAGGKQTLRVESRWTLETLYGPLIKTRTGMPSLVWELDTEVQEVSDEGARFGFRVKEVTAKSRKGVKPELVEAANKEGDSLKGVTGSFSINARGMVEELAIDAPSDASLLASDMIDQIKQAIRLSSLPLPEEPVGKGAKWAATQVIEQRTARSRHTSTFELLDVKGKRVTATSTQAAETPKQSLELPGSRSGASFELHELDFSGESEGAWRLNELGPASASEHILTVFKMTATAPKRETVIMAMDTTIEVKAQP